MSESDTISSYPDKASRFEHLRSNKPSAGTILRSENGKPVPIYVEIRPGFGEAGNRVMFTNALIDEACTGWYLTSETNGLKVLILPRSQKELIRRNGGSTELLSVVSLRVVRHTAKKTALICELFDEE